MMVLKKNKGQALVLVIVVIFIVFFLVVTLSQNISLNTVSTIQNTNMQQAQFYAQSALSGAKALIQNSSSSIPSSGISQPCSGTTSSNCVYTITPSTSINAVLQKDETVTADISKSTNVIFGWYDNTSLLELNFINNDGTNYMCLYYPTGINSNGNYSVPTTEDSSCAAPYGLSQNSNYNNDYVVTFSKSSSNNNWDIVRATLINYSGNSSNVIIIPNNGVTQGYNVNASGYYNGSRIVLNSLLTSSGNLPGIFDYVLYSGGVGSSSPVSF